MGGYGSNGSRRATLPRMRMRSPRTVQHMHPLFISKISSSVSNLGKLRARGHMKSNDEHEIRDDLI